MRICVISPNTFTGDDLLIGEEYDCIPAEDGTDKQNKTFHALLSEYWQSGCHSYSARNFLHFRELVKLYLGAGTEKFYRTVDNTGNYCKPILDYRVKSWSTYSKRERMESIDRLIAEMIQAVVNSKKFYEILDQLEKNSVNLIHDYFQNYKRYNIPKAQLVIADIPYNVGNNAYASNPQWYEG
jgi:hypothetical protein